MKMPFGVHQGKEVDDLPDSYLQWIDRDVKVEPPLSVHPDNREEYRVTRVMLRQEVRRVLSERRRNGVRVADTKPGSKCRSCGAVIVWLTTASGKNTPVDPYTVLPDDKTFDRTRHTSHFATCPNAEQHRKAR